MAAVVVADRDGLLTVAGSIYVWPSRAGTSLHLYFLFD